MKRGHGKVGQIELSFSMIFTIVIIIVTIAVASYVIVKFLNVNKCQEVGNFYSDLEKASANAYGVPIYNDVFKGNLNSFNGKISAVCFGNLTERAMTAADLTKQQDLRKTAAHFGDNVYIYPSSEACDLKLASQNVQYITTPGFFCASLVGGNLQVRMTKNQNDALVTLSR